MVTVRSVLRCVATVACLSACQKNYLNMHNGAPLHEVRVVHNCSNRIAKVYFDREYAMKGHITGTSHSILSGYPLRIKLAAGTHRMIIEDAPLIYAQDFRVAGPMTIVNNCERSR
jgi:hypothetical protein